MLSGKKQNALFFLVVLAIFGAILVFLVFFTPGLSVSVYGSGNEKFVVVANTSGHSIRDVSVAASDGKLLKKIGALEPGQKQEMPLEGFMGTVTIVASAPFHATASTDVFFETPAVNISYKIQQQSLFFVGGKAKIVIEVCRQGALPKTVSVSESFDEAAVEASQRKQVLDFNAGGCVSTDFLFTPKKPGAFEIFFNLNAENVSESFKRTINVNE